MQPVFCLCLWWVWMVFLERCFCLRLQKARPLLFPFGRTNREETGVQLSFPGGSDGKESACSAGDPGSIPRSGRSTGEGHGNPLQYSCLENPIDREAWRATVHGATKSRTQQSYNTFTSTLWAAHLFRGSEPSWWGPLLVNIFLEPEGNGCVLTLISLGKPSMGSERKSIFYSHKSRERQRGGVKSRLHLWWASWGFSHPKMRTSVFCIQNSWQDGIPWSRAEGP